MTLHNPLYGARVRLRRARQVAAPVQPNAKQRELKVVVTSDGSEYTATAYDGDQSLDAWAHESESRAVMRAAKQLISRVREAPS